MDLIVGSVVVWSVSLVVLSALMTLSVVRKLETEQGGGMMA
jgi:hypothetical protein